MLTHFINSLVYTVAETIRYFNDKTKTTNWIQFVQYCIQRHTDEEYTTKIGEEFAQIISMINNASRGTVYSKIIDNN